MRIHFVALNVSTCIYTNNLRTGVKIAPWKNACPRTVYLKLNE